VLLASSFACRVGADALLVWRVPCRTERAAGTCRRFFWGALPGEKHVLVLANTEHTLLTSIAKLVRAIAAFHLSVMDGQGPHSDQGAQPDARREADLEDAAAEVGGGGHASGEAGPKEQGGEGPSQPEEGLREGEIGEVAGGVYRLCSSRAGLGALYRGLLDDSRPWRSRWLEGLLGAFGREDRESWEQEERHGRGGARGAGPGWQHWLKSGRELRDGAESGRFLSMPQDEEEWARECARLVQATERGLLRSPRRARVGPLGGNPGRARPKYRYTLDRAAGTMRIFCSDVPQTIIQW
jgi:hypothetical protein